MTESETKTIFLVLDSGVAIRNILRTDVFRVLKEDRRLRLVLFSPLVDDEFRREMSAPNVVSEPLPRWRPNLAVQVLRSLKKDIWAEQVGLFTFKSKRGRKEGRWLRHWLLSRVVRPGTPGRAEGWLRRIDRLEAACTPRLGTEHFERYRPGLVFFTTIYSRNHCLEIGARQRGVRTACFILSWDNPTSKGPFPFRPDRFILWNNILREELIQYHGYRDEDLFVSGVPQFDLYLDRASFLPRAEFFAKWGLDPALKLITYTTGTPGTSPFDHEVVELLDRARREGAFAMPSQLLVRLHPKDRPEDYRRFEGQPGLVLQRAGRSAPLPDQWNPTREDMYGLAELMSYSDVVINVASTITIDASVFDKPVVNVAFDGFQTHPYAESCQRYYEYEHYRRIVQTGGVQIARTAEEMVAQVNRYLRDPTLESEGRRRIREEQCWKLDGQSGRRIAQYLSSLLSERRGEG